MLVKEKGVLPDSYIYLHPASNTAKETFFYPLCCGKYHCDKNYVVSRTSFDSFLLLIVLRGKGFAKTDTDKYRLETGDCLLIDCYKPHSYGTQTGWDILWVHFDGPLARNYYNLIPHEPDSVTIKNSDSLSRYVDKLFMVFHNRKKPSEAAMSKYIMCALTEIIQNDSAEDTSQSIGMEEIRSYISENIDKPLTLDDLAKKASLSPYYFTRLFKKEIGYTPHEYIIMLRMNAAKFYLRATNLAIKEIAFRTGYTSECTFCTCFKKEVGTTPLSYRNS